MKIHAGERDGIGIRDNEYAAGVPLKKITVDIYPPTPRLWFYFKMRITRLLTPGLEGEGGKSGVVDRSRVDGSRVGHVFCVTYTF